MSLWGKSRPMEIDPGQRAMILDVLAKAGDR
jgi:hypothetical protein